MQKVLSGFWNPQTCFNFTVESQGALQLFVILGWAKFEVEPAAADIAWKEFSFFGLESLLGLKRFLLFSFLVAF